MQLAASVHHLISNDLCGTPHVCVKTSLIFCFVFWGRSMALNYAGTENCTFRNVEGPPSIAQYWTFHIADRSTGPSTFRKGTVFKLRTLIFCIFALFLSFLLVFVFIYKRKRKEKSRWSLRRGRVWNRPFRHFQRVPPACQPLVRIGNPEGFIFRPFSYTICPKHCAGFDVNEWK